MAQINISEENVKAAEAKVRAAGGFGCGVKPRPEVEQTWVRVGGDCCFCSRLLKDGADLSGREPANCVYQSESRGKAVFSCGVGYDTCGVVGMQRALYALMGEDSANRMFRQRFDRRK